MTQNHFDWLWNLPKVVLSPFLATIENNNNYEVKQRILKLKIYSDKWTPFYSICFRKS